MVSILMPIYNGVEFIDESVSSVLRQSYEEWELIIAINGHPCDSEVYKTAKQYEKSNNKIRVFDFYNTKGKSNTLNRMIPLCKFNHVALLDVDDVWHHDKLMRQTCLLNRFDVIATKCVYFGDILGIIPDIPAGDISDFDFKKVNPIINSSCIIRKELCYWDDKWNGIEDYDLWLRLRKDGRKFYNFKEILLKHRIHNESMFNAKGNHLNVNSLLEKF